MASVSVSGQKAGGAVQSRTVLQSASYNAQHQPLSVTDGEGRTTTTSYTAWGAPVSVSDPLGTTTASYNSAFRVSSTTRDGVVQGSVTYDHVGRVKTATDMTGLTLAYCLIMLNLIDSGKVCGV